MAKLTIRVRTRDNLLELLSNGESPAWNVGVGRENEITNVEVVNWDGSQMIEGQFDKGKSQRVEDNDLVLSFFDAHIVNCSPAITFNGQATINYREEPDR